MQETETLLSIIQKRQLWNEMLESHVPGNCAPRNARLNL
jgi:hypothetical protein